MSSRKNYRFVIWFQSPLGRWVNHILWRFPPWKAMTSRLIWRELDRDVAFRTEIKQAKQEYEEGRWYSWNSETHEATPNPNWPKDGKQPSDYDRKDEP